MFKRLGSFGSPYTKHQTPTALHYWCLQWQLEALKALYVDKANWTWQTVCWTSIVYWMWQTHKHRSTCPRKNYNPRQCTIEMSNPNAKKRNCVCLIMNISATELPNFIRKYYFLHELLISKYWRQNISVYNIASHTAVRHSGVQPTEHVRQCICWLMKHQTSSLQLCGLQLTVLTLTQSTARFRGSCRIVCTAARFVTSTTLSRARSKSGNISTRWSSIKRSGSGIHVFELAFDFEHSGGHF